MNWGFLLSVLKIGMIDLVLSGDNAVAIALAVRRLPQRQARRAVLFGAVGAVALRVVFTAVIARLLSVPLLRFLGGAALAWIAVRLLADSRKEAGEVREAGGMMEAVAAIVAADLVMSLENMLGVAGASGGDLKLLAFGLLASISIIMASSAMIAGWMDRYPVLVRAGAGVLGITAGEMMLRDATVAGFAARRTGLCLSSGWHAGAAAALPHRHWAGWAFVAAVACAVLAAPAVLGGGHDRG